MRVFLDGDAEAAAAWLPYAKSKLFMLKNLLRLSGNSMISRGYDLDGGDTRIFVSSVVGQDEVRITCEPWKVLVSGTAYHGSYPNYARQWDIERYEPISGARIGRVEFGSSQEMYPYQYRIVYRQMVVSKGIAFVTELCTEFVLEELPTWTVSRRDSKGEKVWEISRPDLGPAMCTNIVVLGSHVYLVGYVRNPWPYNIEQFIEKRKLSDGELVWEVLESTTSILGSSRSKVSAIALSDGDTKKELLVITGSCPGDSSYEYWTTTAYDCKAGAIAWTYTLADRHTGAGVNTELTSEGAYISGVHGLTIEGLRPRFEKRDIRTGDLLWAKEGPFTGTSDQRVGKMSVFGHSLFALHTVTTSYHTETYLWRRDRETGDVGENGWSILVSVDDTYTNIVAHNQFVYLCGMKATNPSDRFAPTQMFVEARAISDGALVWRKISDADDYGAATHLEMVRT